ncbi:hypothetical protein [Streptomyces sulphureus]|uniref:hypothetical protein n=1 Tax=Streptomyces sulphureus TaxID=47758 RepID=UPI0003793183|nr:hypothetical protein [Streptomyces sulphureus]
MATRKRPRRAARQAPERPAPVDSASGEVAEGLVDLEGYLLAHSAIDEARVQAASFTRRLPWLTGEQRREVETLYAGDHLDHTRRSLQATTRRAGELRLEYQHRYDRLKARCTALFLAATAAASGVLTLLGLAARS